MNGIGRFARIYVHVRLLSPNTITLYVNSPLQLRAVGVLLAAAGHGFLGLLSAQHCGRGGGEFSIYEDTLVFIWKI